MGVNGLSGTLHAVSVFALENGLPFPKVVTSPWIAAVAGDNQGLKNGSIARKIFGGPGPHWT